MQTLSESSQRPLFQFRYYQDLHIKFIRISDFETVSGYEKHQNSLHGITISH